MKNYLLESRCPQLTRHLVNREEQGKLIDSNKWRRHDDQ